MDRYILKKSEIEDLPGIDKTHFLNDDAKRNNKSLGDLTGITGFGFHIIEVPPSCESTEYHQHTSAHCTVETVDSSSLSVRCCLNTVRK